MKTIFVLLFLFFYSLAAFTMEEYHKGDTIRYKFDKVLIEVASTNALSNEATTLQLKDRIKQIQNILNEMTIVPPANDERVTICLREAGDDLTVWNYKEVQLSHSKKDNKTLVIFDDGTTFEKDFGKYCISLPDKEVDVKIFVTDLDDLSVVYDDSFAKKTTDASEFLSNEFDKKYRKEIQAWLDVRGNEVKGHFQNVSFQTNDMIIISGGVGSGWIKNTFVSDINLSLGLSFGNKGMFKNMYSVDWNMMYDFSESNENKLFELNHFVSLAWEHNFSSSPEDDKWYGFSVGYLVGRNNDFFKKNTFKVGVNKKINNTFVVKPELYFNDFLKNVYPGIRLSVAF